MWKIDGAKNEVVDIGANPAAVGAGGCRDVRPKLRRVVAVQPALVRRQQVGYSTDAGFGT